MKTYRIRRPKIVIIGGGTGLPVILKGLRDQSADITAIVTVADDGGSSGVLRSSSHMSPPGDLRNVLVALSDMPEDYSEVFQYRFGKEHDLLANHTIGNIVIAAISEMKESTYEAVQMLSHFMHVDGRIYPASEKALTLYAVYEDGTRAVGESHIVKERKPIDYVYVRESETDREAKPARNVIQAIEEADMIVLGPGSMYTSILPNLMISEVGQAIAKSKGEVVYICNIMTQKGETENFTDADHVRVLHHHLKEKFVDTVLVNTEIVPEDYMDQEAYDEYLVQVRHDFQGLRDEECRVISADFLELRDGGVFHDGNKVVEELFRLVFGAKY